MSKDIDTLKVEEIFNRTTRDSGITIDSRGNEFKGGSICSLAGSEIVIPFDSFNRAIIREFMERFNLMFKNGCFLETWNTDTPNEIHMDVLINFSFLAELMDI